MSTEQIKSETTMGDLVKMDPIVDPLLAQFDGLLSKGIPSAYRIWSVAQKYLQVGDTKNAIKCQNLNYLLHNSYIPNALKLSEGVHFGYGGIGLVIHEASEIGKFVVIGANVTLGGGAGGRRLTPEGKTISIPCIGDYAYIATGSKILGGVTVGALAIVGANAVVTKDVPPLSIVSGAPAKEINRITPENCLRYKSTFIPLRKMPNDEYIALVKSYGVSETESG